MNEGLKVKRFDLLNEDDFVIIKDKQMLLHNIKNVELKEKDKEIERLNNIIKEVREYIEEWQRFPHTNGSTHKELKNLIDILDKENK